MPFIHVKTNQKITAAQEQALKTQLGEAIALIPGKTERWLMVQVEDGDRLWFAGSNAPAALLEVQLFGRAQPKDYDRLTAAAEARERVLRARGHFFSRSSSRRLSSSMKVLISRNWR